MTDRPKTKTDPRERLAALARASTPSKTQQLEALWSEIQAAFKSGATRESVRRELAACGLEFTQSGFDSALRNIRKRRGLSKTRPGQAGTHASPPGPASDPSPQASIKSARRAAESAMDKREAAAALDAGILGRLGISTKEQKP